MSASAVDRDTVLSAFVDGVKALEEIAGRITDWSAPTPCEQWQAADLAGHLVAVVRYYHDLLDAAEAARPRVGLPTGQALAAMNAHDLRALSPSPGPDRIAAFVRMARDYSHRLSQADWHTTVGEWDGIGPLTVAQHTGLAMGEWHIHAWDLARSAGQNHQPADPNTIAAGRSVLSVPRPKEDPWLATLVGSGRRPEAPESTDRPKER